MKKIVHVFLVGFISLSMQTSIGSESMAYSITRGGKLYDKWFKTNSTMAPTTANPGYPDNSKYKGKKASDWRCKECHGWDYMGRNGAYGTGKHFTGIKGLQSARQIPPRQLGKILLDKNHNFGEKMLAQKDLIDLSHFLQNGTFDMGRYIDRKNKHIYGDIPKGRIYYQTICAGCHDLDGKGEDTGEALGEISRNNPWETMHKIVNGQPGEEMPALFALDRQIIADILAYIQTLPE